MFHTIYLTTTEIPQAMASLFRCAMMCLLLTCICPGYAESTKCEKESRESARKHSETVKVLTEREGETTQFYVQNNELCEITMTFEMGLVNLKGIGKLPFTITCPPGQTTKTFTLSPTEPGIKWEYSYTNYYKLGSHSARHDDTYVYQLPYSGGSSFRVTQAYGGSFSHKGSNKYAIDWKMPQGTPVLAARGGLVVKTKDDSEIGGASLKYDPYNNFVLIRQDDGTLAHYCHLQKDGCRVKPGQRVEAGELIARSGNTGFSSGPHLHFCVFKTKDGRERESIPVHFKTAEETAATLRTGRNYKATGAQIASLDSAGQNPATHQGGVSQ